MSDAPEAAGRSHSSWGPLPSKCLPFSLLLGPHLTQVSVMQYGSINTIDIPWDVAQEKAHLLSLVDLMQREGGPSQVGNAGPTS